MEPVDYLVAVRRNWLLIAMLTAAGIAMGLISGLWGDPTYRATTSVLLAPTSAVRQSELGQINSFMTGQIQSYAELAVSPRVLGPVGEETGTPDLADRVSAEVPIDTFVIDISVVDSDPAQAARLANASASELQAAVGELAPREGVNEPIIALETVGVAEPPAHAESPRKLLRLAVGAGIGLFFGVVLAITRHAMGLRRAEDKVPST